MSHIFVPDAVRCILQATGPSGQEFQHVFHMKNPSGTPDYAFCVNCASTIDNWVGNYYKNMCNTATNFRQVVATGINAVPAAQAAIPLTQVGTRAGVGAPSQISCKLKFATNTSGRRHMGGVYAFAPVVSDLALLDKFTSAYMTALLNVFGQLIFQANGNGCPLSILSYTDGAAYPILRVIGVDDVMDSRRRRTANRGG